MKHDDLERGDPVEVELDGAWVPATVVRVIVNRGVTLALRDGRVLEIPHASQARPLIEGWTTTLPGDRQCAQTIGMRRKLFSKLRPHRLARSRPVPSS
jgi:hypothetical protein